MQTAALSGSYAEFEISTDDLDESWFTAPEAELADTSEPSAITELRTPLLLVFFASLVCLVATSL